MVLSTHLATVKRSSLVSYNGALVKSVDFSIRHIIVKGSFIFMGIISIRERVSGSEFVNLYSKALARCASITFTFPEKD